MTGDNATGTPLTARAEAWASTMAGFEGAAASFRHAHGDSFTTIGQVVPLTRTEREAREARDLAPGATRADGAGSRVRAEEPDAFRTCFERDRDRILHATAFRRLAGKTQVFVFPDDHQRTRLTHALEVAQVATAIARSLSLNVALVEAIALGHDCGHGPGGHASEDALGPYLDGGFDHAVFGADVVLAPLNLTSEVLDGIRNHSWSRPAPRTPEGEVVSWADRIAYVCHDFEDAVVAGIVRPLELPEQVRRVVGSTHGAQLGTFIEALVSSSAANGTVSMASDVAAALGDFRLFNYDRIYLRRESKEQADAVIAVLRRLVDGLLAERWATTEAVAYVAGMTDKFAFKLAVEHLDYPVALLPRGIDSFGGGH
ncbi:MAG TPA: HD domain-containing protein [Acidimicrobiales bacterium]